MAIFLCLQMGGPWVHWNLLLLYLTRSEIIEWIQVYAKHPFGPEREDERAELQSVFAVSAFSRGEHLGQQMSAFKRLKDDVESGTITKEQYEAERNRIREKNKQMSLSADSKTRQDAQKLLEEYRQSQEQQFKFQSRPSLKV